MRYLTLLIFILISQASFSAVTFVSASGASRAQIPTGSKAKIFGGYIVNSGTTCENATGLCDTCKGQQSSWAPCNLEGVTPDTQIVFTAKTDNASLAPSTATVTLKLVSGGTTVTGTSSSSGTGEFSFSTTWREICRAAGDSSCETSFSEAFNLGVSSTGSSDPTEKTEIQLTLSAVDTQVATNVFGTACDTSASNPGTSGQDGYCEYFVKPGDGKVYVENLYTPSTTFVSPNEGTKWSAIIFFYGEGSNASAVFSSMRNNSPSKRITFDNSLTTPNIDNRVTGLENNKYYCFLLANEDEAGNIWKAINYAGYTSDISSLFCAPVVPVVGLLDNKKCFIATAAFGSPAEPAVQALRDFRDQYLLRFATGRKFVKWYYKTSPPYAQIIAQNETLKGFVRLVLYPIIFFSYLLLHLSFVVPLVLSLIIFFFLMTRNKLKRRHSVLTLLFLLFLLPSPTSAQQTDELSLEETATASESENQAQVIEPISTSSPAVMAAEPDVSPAEVIITPTGKFIRHPMSKKGLKLIDRDGSYYYETKTVSSRDETSAFRLGNVDPNPKIESSDGETNFNSMYGTTRPLILMYEYEWKPLKRFGALGVQLGLGFFTAQGNGRFDCTGDSICGTEAREQYTFYAFPLNLGVVYRFQYKDKQLFAPYLAGGLSYYALAEMRDDGKSPTAIGTPTVYGSGGLLFNLSSLDKEFGYRLDSEYGLNTMWLNLEARQIQSTNEDLDFSGTMLSLGVTVDY